MNSIGLRHISIVRSLVFRMSSTNSAYEEAICKLNSLQSNKSTLEQIKKGLQTGQKCTNIEDMENYLRRIGIPLSRLDELSVIHVAGTKGKGSTSAMCESILRQHGFRTGFYSSPHLVAARERIRLDGRPLSREQFATSLHHVYGLLRDTQEFEGDMPKYFAFLTVVAFHVFLQRRVDVAVVEVGIGGRVDYTNVLRKVPVVGIAALGLDHTSILGRTLAEIAAAKAGVMKPRCAAYTVRQPPLAMAVLEDNSRRAQCSLTVVPDYTCYTFPDAEKSHLPVDLDSYRTNASLAIQLSHAWMRATQANFEQNSSVTRVTNGHNGLHYNITNHDQNGSMNGDDSHDNMKLNGIHNVKADCIQIGSNKIQNGWANGNALKHSSAHVSDLRNKVTNGTNNNLRDGKILNGGSHMNSSLNGLPKYLNQCTPNGTDGLTNGVKGRICDDLDDSCNKITNGTNKVQNGMTNGKMFDNLVYEVPYETAEGLRQCRWPGRYQVIEGEYAKFYLDGAHTQESMEICAQWFTDNSSSADKCLIFSATGDRNAATLLQPLTTIPFTQIYFVIPTAHKVTNTTHDNYSLVEQEELVQRCRNHAQIWQRNNSTTKITVLECVADALVSLKELRDKPSVLITGSLHLVGAALSILDPSLST